MIEKIDICSFGRLVFGVLAPAILEQHFQCNFRENIKDTSSRMLFLHSYHLHIGKAGKLLFLILLDLHLELKSLS